MDDHSPTAEEWDRYRIGENLYGLSLHEIEARIAAYGSEIERLGSELRKKSDEKQAADRLFGKN